MARHRRFSFEFKRQVVLDVLEERVGLREMARKHFISRSLIRAGDTGGQRRLAFRTLTGLFDLFPRSDLAMGFDGLPPTVHASFGFFPPTLPNRVRFS